MRKTHTRHPAQRVQPTALNTFESENDSLPIEMEARCFCCFIGELRSTGRWAAGCVYLNRIFIERTSNAFMFHSACALTNATLNRQK